MSDLANTLAFYLKMTLSQYPIRREYGFHSTRRWRFDLAWPDYKVAVEVQGGTKSGGRHNRAQGMRDDAEKVNAATLDGWRVLLFTDDDVHNYQSYCADVIRCAIEGRPRDWPKRPGVFQ